MIHALKTGEKCPNGAVKETAGSCFCKNCPFHEANYRFFMSYGPSMLYAGKDMVYCSLDLDSRGTKGEKPKKSGKGSRITLSVPVSEVPAYRKEYGFAK